MDYGPRTTSSNPSLIHLFLKLPRDIAMLVRSHMHLAALECRKKAGRAVKHLALLCLAAVILYLGLLAAIAAFIIVLAIFVPLWVSVVCVTMALFLAGGAIAWNSLSKLKEMDWRPARTIEAFRESVQWLKEKKGS